MMRKKVVSAQEFRVVDDQGNTRARFGMNEGASNTPELVLWDEKKQTGVQLLFLPEGPLLSVTGNRGSAHIQFLRGEPVLQLRSAGGGFAILAVGKGQPGVSLYDESGGEARAELFLSPEGEPQLRLRDRDRKIIWDAP